MQPRPNNPILFDPIVVHLTVESSSEGSSGSSNPQVVRESVPVAEQSQLTSGSPPVKFLKPSASRTQLPNTSLQRATVTITSALSSSEAQLFTGFCAQSPSPTTLSPVFVSKGTS